MAGVALPYPPVKPIALCLVLISSSALGQIQVDLKLPRLQFIAYEPVIATVGITNLAGRDIDLHDLSGQPWFGFEVTGQDGQLIGTLKTDPIQPPLKIETGKRVTQKINLTSLFVVHDFGAYHVRAHVYFADLGKFFYSPAKVFEVTDARPIWQQTVGIPEGTGGGGDARSYSLLSNRFPDHTSLYVRVEDKDRGIVYATYSLGRIIALDEPQAELDRANQLHVLFCAAPRAWAYDRVGLNGDLLAHETFMETKSRPRLVRSDDGEVRIAGGMLESPLNPETRSTAPKLSDRPPRPAAHD
ncbi:MAG TPA: hypothetical protein VEI58_09075 [Chthoniobacterales bacterium]|nr:hypothetical protein [Chthoniobacterales bacterium]